MTSNLIVHNSDTWPFERIKFDPDIPEEVPTETLQWLDDFHGGAEQRAVRHVVRSRWLEAESKLRIEYHAEDQRHLPDGWPSAENIEFWAWGVHILTIEPGKSSGPSTWQHDSCSEHEETEHGWRLETISGGKKNRQWGTIWKIQRGQQGQFRQSLLAMDKRCALTGESCESSLEAAHIIPAHEGGPEYPENGMLLRADIHRLFDAGKFRICPESGKVMVDENFDYGSCRLQEAHLSEGVLKRIRTALSSRV